MVLGSSPLAVTSPSDFAPASSKEFLDIQATIECGFTLKRVRDMTRTYSHNRVSKILPKKLLQGKVVATDKTEILKVHANSVLISVSVSAILISA